MALETYKWGCQLGGGPVTRKKTVRTAQFGDGYAQVAEEGINSTMIEVPLVHTGFNSEIDQVQAFLEAHMVKAFAITPPGGVLGLYRVASDSLSRDQVSANTAILSFTIRRAYGVYA